MDILLFSHEAAYSAAAAAAVSRLVVDWEFADKHRRQQGHDTQINQGTSADLRAAVAAAPGRVICRINNSDAGRDRECQLAIELGASEIWLPMLRRPAEAEHCLRRIDGRARLGVLIETREAMLLGRELQALRLARAYIGLHDYRIDCGHAGLFDPLVDGSLDRFREHWHGDFGFAGVTEPDGGVPIPQRLLLAEMARLGCGFGVARRCFRKDVPQQALPAALVRIQAAWQAMKLRPVEEAERDRAKLVGLVAQLRQMESPAVACAL